MLPPKQVEDCKLRRWRRRKELLQTENKMLLLTSRPQPLSAKSHMSILEALTMEGNSLYLGLKFDQRRGGEKMAEE